MLVDSHCHLDYYAEAEIGEVLARARAAGVAEMVTIGTRMGEQAETVKRLAASHPGVWATVGVHPHNAGEAPMPEVADLLAASAHPRVIGLGESGLDYFYDKSPRDAQREGFRRHIRAARESGLPLVVHARDADDDVATILEEEHTAGPFGFVLHCFSSGARLAQRALALGGYVSFSGILTFPKSQELRDIASGIPEDRLLVETDAPYLAPVPFRGKRNEPGFVPHTARVLAETRGVSAQHIAEATSANFRRLFARAA
jgi:TatD DNase family protein